MPTDAGGTMPDRFTTVMNWSSYAPIEWEGRRYGAKGPRVRVFQATAEAHAPQRLEMAMGQGIGSKRPTEELRALGWIIHEAGEVLPDHLSYREFLRTSKAEWSVAKHGYVLARTGWFSCRNGLLPSRWAGPPWCRRRAGASTFPRRRLDRFFHARRSGRRDQRYQRSLRRAPSRRARPSRAIL